jgi:hypothetical protein
MELNDLSISCSIAIIMREVMQQPSVFLRGSVVRTDDFPDFPAAL